MPQAVAARVRLGLSRKDAQQARLAGAVEAHDDDALATLDLERHVAKNERTAVTLAEAGRGEHDESAVGRFGKCDLDLAFALRRVTLVNFHAVDSLEDRLRGP